MDSWEWGIETEGPRVGEWRVRSERFDNEIDAERARTYPGDHLVKRRVGEWGRIVSDFDACAEHREILDRHSAVGERLAALGLREQGIGSGRSEWVRDADDDGTDAFVKVPFRALRGCDWLEEMDAAEAFADSREALADG